MNEMLVASLSAFWLGVLTSISPCPLATNIAAISFVGRRLENPRRVLLGGLAYTAGRALAYAILGALLVASLLNAPMLSHVLQKYLNQALGPLLILIGMFLLELVSFGTGGGGVLARFQERAARHGIWGALLLGFLFALSFCPISAVLFFGSLMRIPLKPITRSAGSRSPIPRPSDHRFRRQPITRSGGCRSPYRSEATLCLPDASS